MSFLAGVLFDEKSAIILFCSSCVWCVIFLGLLLILFITVLQKSNMVFLVVVLFIYPLLGDHWDLGIFNKIFLFSLLFRNIFYVILRFFLSVVILCLLRGLFKVIFRCEILYFPSKYEKNSYSNIYIYFSSFLLLAYILDHLICPSGHSVRICVILARNWFLFNVCCVCRCQKHQIPLMSSFLSFGLFWTLLPRDSSCLAAFSCNPLLLYSRFSFTIVFCSVKSPRTLI